MKKELNKTAEKSCPSVGINWYPGHMAKTKRQIQEDLKLIDVVVEILDARIPVSSQNPDIKEIIKDKKKVIALNKSDLADDKETKKWVEYFEKNNNYCIDINSNTGNGINNLIKKVEKIMSSELKKNENKGRVGKSIRILVVGIPNVGKSSFINRISKKNSMEVGNRPGVTKKKQWIRINNNIELLDTPGVLWPKFQNESIALNLSYTGTIKDEILPKVNIAFSLIKYMMDNYKLNIMERYKLDESEIEDILKSYDEENEKIYQIMKIIGKKRGCIVRGNQIDDEKVSNIILEDFRTGKLGKITLEKIK